jgi:hypothetical protein
MKFLLYVERHEKGISGGLAGALQKQEIGHMISRKQSMESINE